MSKSLAKRKTRGLTTTQVSTAALVIALVVIIYLLMKNRQSVGSGFSNAEIWEWTDWRGNERKITVHRESKLS